MYTCASILAVFTSQLCTTLMHQLQAWSTFLTTAWCSLHRHVY